MKRIKINFTKSIREKVQKTFAFKLALILLLECAWPTASMALTGGPSQPEVQSFEPIGVSDMVDLFSGDFSYNIPLFDIDGYPMNLSYHSGIGMDQEASWVGLGWNVNPGVINRGMRGLPDDFNGDNVVKEQNIKKNQTVGLSCAFAGELFGYDGANFTARLGIKYNNYTGVGVEKSFNVSLSASNKYGGTGSVGLGITSSSDDGLSLAPSVSLGVKTSKTEKDNKLGVSVGASFNSRGGLTALTISPDVTQAFGKGNRANDRAMGTIAGMASAKFDFGQQTYSPSLDFPMENLSVTANFKFGFEAWGFAGSIAPGGYYAEQGQLTKTINSPAYGYMNAHNGQNNNEAMMDFNREKDGSFSKSTYNLPITNLTYDLYTVSGQGTSGSYRPFRSDVGHVFDVESYSTSDGYSGSLEIGAGGIFKGGVDISKNSAYSHSGDWTSSKAYENMAFQASGPNPDYEAWYFKEANERSINSDPDFLKRYGGFSATRFELDGSTEFDTKTTGKIMTTTGAKLEIGPSSQRAARDKKNQTISILTNREVYEGMGVFGGSAGSGMANAYITTNINKFGHHIGQITSMNTDGKRYVYALPVYNKDQQEVTFAVGKPVGGGSARTHTGDEVTYTPGQDNSLNNKMGLDNYYSKTKMPPFAHSYLLSAVLSSDYVDITGDGPTDDDLGNYVLFNYSEKSPNYNWRTPTKQKVAKYNQGLLADDNDDKGSYVYGTKQLYYLNQITTKNYQADFTLSARLDGKGVTNQDGGTAGAADQFRLDKIDLKSKASGKILKTVHFKYQYNLCAGAHNSSSGKLMLEELYFTYQNSEKGAYNAYNFSYGTLNSASDNPGYNSASYDRWGNYKSTNPSVGTGTMIPMDYFPYTNQYLSQSQLDADASVWNLKEIGLPSGGKITVNYESDDYAFVQDKQATQMYVYEDPGNTATPTPVLLNNSFSFYFKIPDDAPSNVKISDFLPDNKMVFFKFRMLIDPATSKYDYVPGYAEIDVTNLNGPGANTAIVGGPGNPRYGKIAFVLANINDNTTSAGVHAIVKAALQFGRLNTPRIIWDQPNASAGINTQIVNALVNSSFFSTIQQAVQGPNAYLFSKFKAQKADLTSCWLKLKNVTGKKYGGGCRVKQIVLNDDFRNMTGNQEESSEYGQMYTYTTTDSRNQIISSGVATYEPQVGGEENALKEPFFTETKKLLVPDDEHYTEAPFGESFFPSASVGYSKVRVENYYPDPANIPAPYAGQTFNNKKTGCVINEFYTAKDFPTITERTDLEAIEHKTDPFSLASIFSINTKNHMTASQGYYVELNDMHGKPKATKTYNVRNQQISSVEYFYKSQAYGGSGSRRLINQVQLINSAGGVATGEVGVFFDAVGDLREQTTETETDGLNINTDIIQAVIPVITVVPIPSYASDKTQFRSAVITKVVQRFGILEKTIAKQDGSTVTSSDVAYDAETGEVLLSKTMNGFNDAIYSFKYPAYWYYNGMGPAYKNLNYTQQITFSSGAATLAIGTNLFVEGDEIELQTIPSVSTQQPVYGKAWIKKSQKEKIEAMDQSGAAVVNGTYIVKVIRSGRRNMQTMDMANITTMVNPIAGVRSNIYQRVISAKAIEYNNAWDVNCECYAAPVQGGPSPNPYITGQMGNWRSSKSYEYLSPRSQTNANNNSNLRSDGFYTSYSPFYKNVGGKWKINPANWTYASEVTYVGPTGQELENRDALGKYSSADFGFNQTLATAVAANTRYKELGYENFEYQPSGCTPDNHFKHVPIVANIGSYDGKVITSDSHSGYGCLEINYAGTGVQGSLTSPSWGISKALSTFCGRPDACPGYIIYDATLARYRIEDAVTPFILDVQKLSGDGSVQLNPDGKSFKVNPLNSNFKCQVTIIDQKGCVYNKLIVSPYTN